MNEGKTGAHTVSDTGRTLMRFAQRAVKLIDVLLVALVFDRIWFLFYAQTIAAPFYRRGNAVVVGLFLVLYYLFAHLYNGSRFTSAASRR